jgi:tight adherence protein B
MTAGARRTRARRSGPAAGTGAPSPHLAPGPAAAAGAVGMALAAATAGPTAAVALAAIAAGTATAIRWHSASRDRVRRATQLPQALDALATSLRSGASLPVALDEAATSLEAPLRGELRALAVSAARGRPVTAVLDDWTTEHDDASTCLASTALVLATVVGSAPARALDGVAATLRERLDLAAERRTLSAQARASALVLSVAPVAFALVLMAADTPAATFLLTTPAGWTCLAVGVTLDAAGAWWMHNLTKATES